MIQRVIRQAFFSGAIAKPPYIPIKLEELDLVEKFVKGGGPGGQKINKSVSCVQLKHVPTGIIVKVNN